MRKQCISSLILMIVFMVAQTAGTPARAAHPVGEISGGEEAMNVSVEFVDTEIGDAMRLLAKMSGLNIVSGPKISGKVSARLMDVSIEEALASVCRSCGFSYVKEGNVIRIIEMEEGLVGIDGATPQVLIESRVVEVVLGENQQSGVDWELLSTKITGDISAAGVIDLDTEKSGLFLNIYNGDVDALINLLSRETNTNVLSAPKVMAMDGSEAKILVGEKVAYQQSFGQASGGITTTTVNFEEVGIKLYVTPHVRPGKAIIIDILVEVSSVKEWRTVSNGDEIPIISTKQTTSRVIVDDNSTLIIGGLIGESRIESVYKIPILGDIPIIKYLFRKRSLETNRTELTVFMTPKIIGGITAVDAAFIQNGKVK